MDVQPAVFFKEGKRSRNYKTQDPPTRPCPVFCNGETYLWALSLPILSVSLFVWSGGSPRCGRPHFHSIPPILLWPVGQGDPTRCRAPREYLPRPLPWHRRQRPRVGAPPLFPRTSSTRSRTWWTNCLCRCQSHGSDWTQVCWRYGWWDTSSLGI